MPLFRRRESVAPPIPRRAQHYHRKATRCHEQGKLEEALVNFERVVEAAPQALEPRINLGAIYFQMAMQRPQGPPRGWLEESARQFRRVLGLVPDNAPAALGLAAALDALGEHAAALAELEKLARARPTHRDVQHNLAIALWRAGRLPEARAAVERELAEHPDHTAAAELLARLQREG